MPSMSSSVSIQWINYKRDNLCIIIALSSFIYSSFSTLYFPSGILVYAKQGIECDDKLLMAIIRGRNKAEFNPWIGETIGRMVFIRGKRNETHTEKFKKKKNIKAGNEGKNELNNLIYDINIDWNDLKIISWIKYRGWNRFHRFSRIRYSDRIR